MEGPRRWSGASYLALSRDADEVLVRVRACGLNHLDLWVRNGVAGHRFPLPLIPGSEIAGEIEETGAARGRSRSRPDRSLVAPGVSCGICPACLGANDQFCRSYGIFGEDRDGGYAELVAVPRRNILDIPKGALLRRRPQPSPWSFSPPGTCSQPEPSCGPLEDVLIHAAGSGVSSAGIQIARLLGARRIIATASTEDKRLQAARARRHSHTWTTRAGHFASDVRKITEGKGVEVVFDHVGGPIFEESLRALAWGGRAVLCGATADAYSKYQPPGGVLQESVDPGFDHGQSRRTEEKS